MFGACACSSPQRDLSGSDGGAGNASPSGAGVGNGSGGVAGRAGAGSGQGGTRAVAEAGAAGENAGEAGSDTAGAPELGEAGSGGSADLAGSAGKGSGGGVGTAGTGGAAAPVLLADGAVCTTNAQCSSNSCGGRCCPVGTPCSCPQPDAKNLLKNPGFDSNVSGWNVAGNGTFHWVAVRGNDQDATSCPYSGFGRFYSTGTLTVSQCVAVSTAKSYNISSALSNSSLGDFTNYSFGEMQCNFDWFSSSDCSGASLADGALSRQWLNVDWSPALWDGSPWYPPTGAGSARLSCSDTCDGTDVTDPCYANVDEMGITEAPAAY